MLSFAGQAGRRGVCARKRENEKFQLLFRLIPRAALLSFCLPAQSLVLIYDNVHYRSERSRIICCVGCLVCSLHRVRGFDATPPTLSLSLSLSLFLSLYSLPARASYHHHVRLLGQDYHYDPLPGPEVRSLASLSSSPPLERSERHLSSPGFPSARKRVRGQPLALA